MTVSDEDYDRAIDRIRNLENRLYSCRDAEGKLKVGTRVRRKDITIQDGIVVHVGDIETSPKGRQAYYTCFFAVKEDGTVYNHTAYWVDETQVIVLDEEVDGEEASFV